MKRVRPVFALTVLLANCGGGGEGGSNLATGTTAPASTLSAAATLGRALFFDTALSASGRQSCGTCHVPSRAFTADPSTDRGLPVPLGGADMTLPGFRNTPSLAYASFTPAFSIAADGTPSGGMFRDGRASSLATQATQPFTSVFEMANADATATIRRLRQSTASVAAFIAVYGAGSLDDADGALAKIGRAIAAFEAEDPSFHPFSSKFDFWQQGQAQLTTRELRGLALFNNPAKGNCTACHPSRAGAFSQHPLFTDFSYDNIGVPRNWRIPANAATPASPVDGAPLDYLPSPVDVPPGSASAFYDLGLCGPFAADANDAQARPALSTATRLCGNFKVPSLRNVAITAPYFHNGVFGTLQQVVEFYVTRDITVANPYQPAGTFYLLADGSPDPVPYNDLPVAFDAAVNAGEPPYTAPRSAGGLSPTLDSGEIADLIAFLCTLTDGFDPARPDAYPMPAQCTAPVQ